MRRYLAVALLLLASRAMGSSTTIGPNGIDSLVTQLNGDGIAIGQGEVGRPGKPGHDTDPTRLASNTIPAGVYFQTFSGMDSPNSGLNSDHATEVAGVMIGKDAPCAECVGVAPNAILHAVAILEIQDDVKVALSLNRIATLIAADISAINLSFTPELQFFENLDGNSHATQFIDWSARRHDVLYVVAWGNEFVNPAERKLTDNFNGITVAASEQSGASYRKFWFDNSTTGDADGPRTSIDLLAPGEHVKVLYCARPPVRHFLATT